MFITEDGRMIKLMRNYEYINIYLRNRIAEIRIAWTLQEDYDVISFFYMFLFAIHSSAMG